MSYSSFFRRSSHSFAICSISSKLTYPDLDRFHLPSYFSIAQHGRAIGAPRYARGPQRLGHKFGHVPGEVRISLLLMNGHTLTKISPNMLLSGSRDKTLIIWNLTRDDQAYGYPKRSLHGHSHIVSDCVCCWEHKTSDAIALIACC